MKEFSVVIPTLNAEKTIRTNLECLKKQNKHIKEILILDNESDDQTIDIVKEYETTIYSIPRNKFDHGGTRNLGAKKSSGKYILYLSGDVLFEDKRLLEKISNEFSDKTIAGIYTQQLPRKNAKPIEKMWRDFGYPNKNQINTLDRVKKEGVQALMFSTGCCAIRKDIFEKAGGFPEKIIRNEDMLFAWNVLNMGLKTMYLANCEIYHSHNYSLQQNFQQYFDIGVFFGQNKDLLSATNNSSEGFNRVIRGCKYLAKKGFVYLIPYLLMEAVIKFIGYNLGKRHKSLPFYFQKTFSKHKNYWIK